MAFDKVRRFGKGLAYFPALSISHGENSTLNFGGTPLRYPQEGFQPLQQAPPPSAAAKVASPPPLRCPTACHLPVPERLQRVAIQLDLAAAVT